LGAIWLIFGAILVFGGEFVFEKGWCLGAIWWKFGSLVENWWCLWSLEEVQGCCCRWTLGVKIRKISDMLMSAVSVLVVCCCLVEFRSKFDVIGNAGAVDLGIFARSFGFYLVYVFNLIKIIGEVVMLLSAALVWVIGCCSNEFRLNFDGILVMQVSLEGDFGLVWRRLGEIVAVGRWSLVVGGGWWVVGP
jgi:hypothetical protein